MTSVEQRDDFLNELMEAGATADTDGDAYMAWSHLQQLLIDGSALPHWAAQYFLRVAQVVDDFDPYEGDAMPILRALEIKHSLRRPRRKRKTSLDYDHVYKCISEWKCEKGKPSIDKCVGRYCEENATDEGPLNSDTVRSAYNTVRKERLSALDQYRQDL